ncbi:MAG: hypothetical protein CMD01_04395 [Flavobacteriales bacterium]|nr:hypothetical protein [Flavobacteriales bacterium]
MFNSETTNANIKNKNITQLNFLNLLVALEFNRNKIINDRINNKYTAEKTTICKYDIELVSPFSNNE